MSEPITYARRLVKGSAIVFVALVASGFTAFLLRMLLARSFSATDYGLFYAVYAFVAFLAIFRDFGLNSSLVKYIPEFEVQKRFDRIKSSMAFILLLKAVFALPIIVMLFAFSDQIASAVFGTTGASLVIKILSIWFLTAFFPPFFKSVFLGFQNMLVFASITFFEIFFIFLSAILFVGLFDLGVEGAASAYLLASLIVLALGFALFCKGYPQVLREKVHITKPLIKKLFAFALPVFIGVIGSLIMGYTDTILIIIFRTLREVGFYQTAQPVAHFLWILVSPLAAVLFPMISELWVRRERKLLGNILHFLTKFSFLLIIPAALVFIAFPDVIINLLFGPRYLAGTTVLQILAGATIIHTLLDVLATTINGIGKPIIVTKVVALMACLNLAGNLLLIPRYGIEGAAIATIFAFTLGLVLMFYHARKLIKFTVPASPLLKTLAGGVLTLLLIFGLKSILVLPPWPEAFVVMIPSLVFYGVWILATRAVTKDDLGLIARIVPMPKWLVRAAGRFVGK